MQPVWPQRRTSHPHPRLRDATREALRPPRYRLLRAAADIPARETEELSVSFVRDCPACGASVVFTQVVLSGEPGYLVEQHDCVEGGPASAAG